MNTYNKILLSVDLTVESNQVAHRAMNLGAKEIHVIHVIEPLSLAYGGDIPMDLSTVQDQIHDQAKTHLIEFAKTLNVPTERQYLVFGRPEAEVHRVAEEIDAELIVVGSHGRHGLSLLLGSTANGVLHGASCDVLAVRVGIAEDEQKN
ncbi:MAG: universal stress protein [Pseudomonadales bacterium]|nr:universal stress protein [Pseudomonadales bacterium]